MLGRACVRVGRTVGVLGGAQRVFSAQPMGKAAVGWGGQGMIGVRNQGRASDYTCRTALPPVHMGGVARFSSPAGGPDLERWKTPLKFHVSDNNVTRTFRFLNRRLRENGLDKKMRGRKRHVKRKTKRRNAQQANVYRAQQHEIKNTLKWIKYKRRTGL